MSFESAELRDAYSRGARDACEGMVMHGSPQRLRALADWLIELGRWSGGDPPAPPHAWTEPSAKMP